MILFDTTILVYAAGIDHPLRLPCREVLSEIQNSTIRACTTVEVIQEFAHVWAKWRGRADAAYLAVQYGVGLGPLVRPDDDDLHQGLLQFASSPDLGAFDAVLAASALRRGWTLASADRAFAAVENLLYLDPGSPSFLEDAFRVGRDSR